ncbi:MAG: hypothetical protein AAB834_06220 [Patescibacteria group bacterium]|mgnify:CR=1 FL=1
MAEIEGQTFTLDPQDTSMAYRRSMYRLASATEDLLATYEYPAGLSIVYDPTAADMPGYGLIVPQGLVPTYKAELTGDKVYEITSKLPTLHKGHLVNALEYTMCFPSRCSAASTGYVAIKSVTRIMYPSTKPFVARVTNAARDQRTQPSAVVSALAGTLNEFASQIDSHAAWSVHTS